MSGEVSQQELLAWRDRIYAEHPVTREYYADVAADEAVGLCSCCTKYGEKYLAVNGPCSELDTIAWMLGER